MDFSKIPRCVCGNQPEVFARFSILENLVTHCEIELTEFTVFCPNCHLSSSWIDRSRGGIDTAVRIWNEMILYETDVGCSF